MIPDNLTPHLAAQHTELKNSICEPVRIPSVTAQGDSQYTFGKPIDDALRTALVIANRLGFNTTYGKDGYYGFAEIGDGESLVAVLGHVDVVPPGNPDAWLNDPFTPVEIDGRLFGRGTQDNKGPMLATLFAAKALQQAGVDFNRRLRFIFGTDEESLWRDMDRYIANEEIPEMGFSPDAEFPLIYAEKGLLEFYLESINESGLKLKGGSAFNAVPDAILYTGERQDELTRALEELDYEYQLRDDGIQVLGKAAHAQVPERGINAINRLALGLNAIGVDSKTIRFIAEVTGEDPNAGKIFGECQDEHSGQLKFNLGKIALDEIEQLSIDIRLPVTVSKEQIVKQLSTVAGQYGLSYRQYDWQEPLYMPLDHPLVETLLQVYREVSGDQETAPISSGGATYARTMPNCVAFGAVFPNRPKVEHQPNEYVILEDLHQAMEIYAHAIYALTR